MDPHWRHLLGRMLKGLPADRTFEERYRPQVLEGPGTLEVGSWTYWFPSCRFFTWNGDDRITIGSYTSIAAEVRLVCGGEHSAGVSSFPFSLMVGGTEPIEAASITIGSDVWMATQAMVLGGVTIGHGAVVAARSVVTRDVPPYAVVAGTPARVVRYRFDEETVSRLLSLAWWTWPEDQVRRNLDRLRGADVGALEEILEAHL